jgi:IS30 family transposase
MNVRVGRRLSAAERASLWQRWKTGESMHEIARGLGCSRTGVRFVLRCGGGYAPALRTRAAHQLTLSQREEISRGISAQCSMRRIAADIGKAASTVSREIQRNGGRQAYRAAWAETAAWERGRRPKRCLLQLNRRLCRYVAHGLRRQWSPEQIARRLEQHYPADHSMRVSHETIYRSLFIQARGVLKKELLQHLRTGRQLRHSRHATHKGQARGQIVDAVSIRERPAQAADRAVPGHWEGDLLSGQANTHIATLVERHSRFVMLVKVPNRETAPVVKALTRKIKKLPAELRRSLTWDRGKEMADHKEFTVATDVQVYFCDPHSPWQRGSNENTNGLLRQYFPKGTDLSVHSQAHLNVIANRLNQRPRETLGFRTPAEKLSETVALTG